MAQRRRERTAGDHARRGAVFQQERIAVAGGAAAFDAQGQQFLAHFLRAFTAHIRGGAGQHAAHARLGRGVVLVQLVAIEGQTGFQTQGIARAKAHRLDPLIGQQGFPQGLGLSGRHIEFETQLTGVAGAAHQQLAALPGLAAEAEIGHVAQAAAQQGLQYVHGFGALQVDLAGLLRDVGQGHAFGQAGTQGGKVPGGAGGIDHHHEVVRAETVDDAVIQHRPLFRQQEAVAATARGQRGQVVAHGGGQRRIGTGAPDAELAHMADIEQTGMLTGMLVLHEDALILDGHQPARERRHLGAVGHMPVRERGLEFGHGSFLLSGAAPAG